MSEEFVGAAALTSRYVVAFVLLFAAIPKLADRREFERAVRNYRLLPERIVPAFAAWLPRTELVIAVALLLGLAAPIFAFLAAMLLLAFGSAVGINLIRGREIDCGCRGSVTARRIGWSLVFGDVALAALALFAAVRDPGALAVYSTASATTSLSVADALALLALAAVVVLGWQIAASSRDLWLTSRRRFVEASR